MKLRGLNILLAEDNPTNQMVATQMLEVLGANVTLAADGAEALKIAHTAAFDLMLVDIEMPRVSGLEVIRRIRAEPPPLGETPIAALTAYVMREHREPIMEAGADGIISKPIVSIDGLGSDILDMIAARRTRDGDAGPDADAGSHDPREPAIVDELYARLTETMGPGAMPDLLARVTEDLADAGAQVGLALARGDHGGIRWGTHIIVSVAGAIGATGLQRAAQALNAAAHHGDRDTLRRRGPAMMELIERVQREIAKRRQG